MEEEEEGEGGPSHRVRKPLALDTQWGMGLAEGDAGDAGMVANQGIKQVVAAVPRQQEQPAFTLEGGISSYEKVPEDSIEARCPDPAK